MNYLGKILGGLAGLASGKWPLVLFGIFLGHQFDRGFAQYAARRLPKSFVQVAFAVMGHLCKADGRVSEDEIRLARTAMHALDLDGDQTREAMRCFEAGKRPGFDLDTDLGLLRGQASSPAGVGRQLLQLLVPVLLIKEEPSADERRILWHVAQRFDISRVELAQLEAAARIDRRFSGRGAPRGARNVDAAEAAYQRLGLQPDASDSEIKQAYRRLMNRYHPDKLVGGSASDDDLEQAGRLTREIRAAYDLLRERRGFK